MRVAGGKINDVLRITDLLREPEHRTGLICEEAERALGLRHQTCSARFSEMLWEGLLVLTGERRETSSGYLANVHALPRFMETS
jgi:hypothetical protein